MSYVGRGKSSHSEKLLRVTQEYLKEKTAPSPEEMSRSSHATPEVPDLVLRRPQKMERSAILHYVGSVNSVVCKTYVQHQKHCI